MLRLRPRRRLQKRYGFRFIIEGARGLQMAYQVGKHIGRAIIPREDNGYGTSVAEDQKNN